MKTKRSDEDSNKSPNGAWSVFLQRLLRPIDRIGQQGNFRPKERRRLIIVNRMISLFGLCLLIRQALLLILGADQGMLSLAGISAVRGAKFRRARSHPGPLGALNLARHRSTATPRPEWRE